MRPCRGTAVVGAMRNFHGFGVLFLWCDGRDGAVSVRYYGAPPSRVNKSCISHSPRAHLVAHPHKYRKCEDADGRDRHAHKATVEGDTVVHVAPTFILHPPAAGDVAGYGTRDEDHHHQRLLAAFGLEE